VVQRVFVPHFRCGVVGLIEDGDGRVLLVRHTYRSTYPWGLPTGFLERGEQPDAALRREVREEAGLDVDLSPVWLVYTDERSIVNVVFRGLARGGTFSPSAEISERQFFRPDELPPIIPEQRGLIEASIKEARRQEPA
jgi:ADP-ribose pyrophosphatase YjhB (NUDIX family)